MLWQLLLLLLLLLLLFIGTLCIYFKPQTQQPWSSNCFSMPDWTYLELFRQSHDTHSQFTIFIYQRKQPCTWIFWYFQFLRREQNHFYYGYNIFIHSNPNNEGLQALKHFLNQLPIKRPSSEILPRLAELTLTQPFFIWRQLLQKSNQRSYNGQNGT